MIWIGVLAGLLLLAAFGHALTERAFLIALVALAGAANYAMLRGPAWHAAYRLGRMVEQRRRTDP